MRLFPLCLIVLMSACAVAKPINDKGPINKSPIPDEVFQSTDPLAPPPRVPSRTAVRNFLSVIDTIEPVTEEVCRQRAPQLNCDFLIVYDANPRAPMNAFQKVDETGRPIIIFTLALIAEARNEDELAFVLAHEAAHHIAGHLARQQQAALIGATIFGNLARLSNDPEAVANAQKFGAALGARTYSKEFELEADALGARIAQLAGYDALRGAEFFFRIPDPGNRFLGTHPPNADRFAVVQKAARGT